MMRKINEIIVHCTATPEGKDVKAADIRRFHISGNGWTDIGYHYVIDLDGSVEKGRDVSLPGAHCKGHNGNSIGVAYVGGVAKDGKTPEDTRTEAQKRSLNTLLKSLLAQFPGSRIYSHRDFANKACPSFDATKEYAGLCKTVILLLLLNVCSACGSRKSTVSSQKAEYVEATERVAVRKDIADSCFSTAMMYADSVVITAVKDSVPVRIVAHKPRKEVRIKRTGQEHIVAVCDANEVRHAVSEDVAQKTPVGFPYYVFLLIGLGVFVYLIRDS